MNNFPIGIIDSGSGGVSIWKEIKLLLPHESTIYLGDHAYVPYSKKSTKMIRHRVLKLIRFLREKKVKLIVIACNTATVAGIDRYRMQFPDIPIIGVVPVVKTAAAMTKTKAIWILSTTYTAKSIYQKKLITQFASHITVTSIGSSRLVEYIESRDDKKDEIIKELRKVLKPMSTGKADVLVLGCTHFPLIRENIQQIIGPKIVILDSGPAVARQVKRILENNDAFTHRMNASHEFYTTGEIKDASIVYQRFFVHAVVVLPAVIA